METEFAYFRRRACEEYLAHANAGHPAARETHLALARHYDKLARSIDNDAHPLEEPRPSDPEPGPKAENQVIEEANLWL